mgnify:CR=1 FL=1
MLSFGKSSVMADSGQLAFDFDEFEREDARNNLASWQGAPLHFTTDYYAPEHEQCIAWNDPFLSIQWPDLGEMPKLSAKDADGNLWANARFFD